MCQKAVGPAHNNSAGRGGQAARRWGGRVVVFTTFARAHKRVYICCSARPISLLCGKDVESLEDSARGAVEDGRCLVAAARGDGMAPIAALRNGGMQVHCS